MIEPDWKESYKTLREWIINLRPYCYTCLHNDSDDEVFCDGCDRKSFGWECDKDCLPPVIGKEIND